MPVFKTYGANGAWINGRWHPNGAEAAMNGTTPPVEKTTPAWPGMLEALAAKTETDAKTVSEAKDAKAKLVIATQRDADTKADARSKQKIDHALEAGAETNLPPIAGTLNAVEQPDKVKVK